MLFLLRMLHAQLQRQVHLPEADRPRVPLLVDEAHYVAGGENVVDQIATHRAAGLEAAFGLQYFAQLGSASEHQQKILKGVLNLLQSRFLFRMGDAEDAEQATRIAMAVYATMIRDDPDSRARLRVTPEQALNFPNYYCLASWIADGTRAPSFMGQTYPLPDVGEEWAEHTSPPRTSVSGRTRSSSSPRFRVDEAEPEEPAATAGEAAASAPARAAAEPAKRRPTRAASQRRRRDAGEARGPSRLRAAAEPAAWPTARSAASSAARSRAGPRRARTAAVGHAAGTRVPRPHQRDRASRRTGGEGRLPRLYDEDYTILALLDRVGVAPVASSLGRRYQAERPVPSSTGSSSSTATA